MTDKEILEKAIQKAIDNGWDNSPIDSMEWSDNDGAWRYDAIGGESWHYQTDINTIIFSHDFAKALWGESTQQAYGPDFDGWQYHLQQMVIDDDPIKHLGENI